MGYDFRASSVQGSRDNDDQTLLSRAVGNGHETVAQLLLDLEGVDVESKDTKYGQTSLLWAARKGHETVVKFLLKKAVDVDSKDLSGKMPLSWAARNGQEMVVKLLLLIRAVNVDSEDLSEPSLPVNPHSQ